MVLVIALVMMPMLLLLFQDKKKVLELILANEAEALFGEVAQARFQSLATTLGAQTVIKIRG